MLQAALGGRDRRTGVRSSSCSRGGCPRAAATAWSPASGRALDAIEAFRFDDEALARARATSSTSRRCDWLADYRFCGDIWGYAEGEVYFPYSPLLIVESTFAEAVLLETRAALDLQPRLRDRLGRLADDAAPPATGRASRWARAAPTRRRRWRAARAAYVAGFAASSNLAARQRYGVPTTGTSAHSFTLLHDTEERGVPRPGAVAGRGHHAAGRHLRRRRGRAARRSRWPGPSSGAVRLDSGDLGALAHEVRAQLDGLGAHDTRIIVTSDLDEFAIAALAAAPVDGYGVGTQLVTGSGHPTCGFVYKLVAREDADGRAGRRWRRRAQDKVVDRRAQVRAAPARRRRRRRGRGGRRSASRPRTTATTGSCWCRWCAAARSSGRETLERRPGAAPARRGRSCRVAAPADVARRAGDPDRARLSGPGTPPESAP